MDTELLTSREVENLLRYSPGQATRLARRGKLPHVILPDGSIRFDRVAILAVLQRFAPDCSTGLEKEVRP